MNEMATPCDGSACNCGTGWAAAQGLASSAPSIERIRLTMLPPWQSGRCMAGCYKKARVAASVLVIGRIRPNIRFKDFWSRDE